MGSWSQSNKDEHPFLSEIVKSLFDSMKNLGASSRAPAMIHEASKAAGLVDVATYKYSTLAQPQLHQRAQQWMLRVLQTLIPLMMRQKEPDEETAQRKADELLKDTERYFAAGVVPDASWVVVVGRKPE
jgi:hypothetical protein